MALTTNMNVLIFPAGSEIAIEIFDALKFQKDITVFGATSVDDHSEFLFSRLFKDLPFFSQDGFIDALNQIIDSNNIDFVYPARDDVQLFLIEHQFAIHAQVVSSELRTVEICRSKKRTYELLAEEPFVPETYLPSEIDHYPVFAKPSIGEGSKGAAIIGSRNELDLCLESGMDYVFCEYLPGEEFTIDCFTDADGVLRVAKARVRDRVRSGISVRSYLLHNDDEFYNIARRINEKLSFVGAWFFQMKTRETGEKVLMEVSPRIPGTMGLSRNCGINFPLLTLYSFKGYPLDIFDLGYDAVLDKAFISRYKIDIDYRTVYIDYDDTICLRGKSNPVAMQFLYQCQNMGKRIVLLTKHDGDIHRELLDKRIAESLFDEVVHLKKGDSKAHYIKDRKSILIDDSFSERRSVFDACKIPVFDLGNIEALLDWRM